MVDVASVVSSVDDCRVFCTLYCNLSIALCSVRRARVRRRVGHGRAFDSGGDILICVDSVSLVGLSGACRALSNWCRDRLALSCR